MARSEVSPQTTAGLLDLMVWSSETLLAAELTAEGVVRRANSALLAQSPGVAGQPFHAIVCPPHRALLDTALHGAAAGWSSVRIGLFPDAEDVPSDHRVWISGSPERILLVAERAQQGERRVIDALLALNEELVRARRAERSLGRAQRDRARDRRLLTGWRALSTPPPPGAPPCEEVRRALDVVDAAVHPAAVLVLRGPAGPVVAARGLTGPPGPPPRPARAAQGRPRLAEDPLVIRLLSPRLAAAGVRRLAVVPVPAPCPAESPGALHVGWCEARPRDDDELALLEHAARRMAVAVAETAALVG